MITIEVQFEPYGDRVAYSSPLMVEYGDRVIVPVQDTLAVGYVVGVGSSMDPVDEIVRLVGVLEDPERALRGDDDGPSFG